MDLNVQDLAGKEVSKLSVSDDRFNVSYNEDLVHQAVTAYLAGARQGSKQQKNRSDVRGGGKKPWAQKGSGKARAGTSSSPIWRSGGVTFAARPRGFEQKMNRKMYKGALRSILSELVRTDRFIVVDSLELSAPKTKELVATLNKLNLSNVLIVSGEVNENLYLSARNIPNVGVVEAQIVDPVALVSYDKVLISESAVKQLEERF